MIQKAKFTAFLIIIAIFLTGCIKQNSVLEEKPDQTEKIQETENKPLPIEVITQGWQEYNHDQYGFKIKFPPDWQQHLTYPKPNLLPEVIFSSISEDQRSKQPYAIFFVSVEEAKDRNLTGYNIIGDLVEEGYNQSSLKINNTQAVLLITDDNNKDLASIIILHNDYFYRLTWNATTGAYRTQFEEIFKKIIATFKFI